MAKFKDYNFPPFLQKALEKIDFTEPTAVQERLIPVIRQGKNVIGQSKTGSGKTHTFLLPIIEKIKPELNQVQAVITVPSRELAEQIYQAAIELVQFAEVEYRIANYVGGTDRKRQLEKLEHTQPHLVIGTSGRILDLTKTALKLFTAKTFVVDEADMALDLGFLPEVDQIAAQFSENVQFLVFSATIPQKLQPFLKKYLKNPVAEQIESRTIISDQIDNWLISTKGQDKNNVILNLLHITNPYLAIIFANTKQRVDEIAHFLKSNGLKVAKIHGGIEPRERKRIMKQVRNLDYQYLVATDLAARGIDIEGISHVINDEIPSDLDFFVHRVGRTGRNQLDGIAITLFTPSDDQAIVGLEKMGIQFVPKTIKNAEIVDSYDRNRRQQREKKKDELDPTLIGLVKKKKKKIKPGYKKKINRAISERNKTKRRIETKHKNREDRKGRKQSF